jgi:outer membrane protein assembly factor BamB
MKKSLVRLGGGLGLVMFLACAGNHPRLDINPDPQNMYAGFKGDANRNGYINGANATALDKQWQIKFKNPLYYSPSLAGSYLFQPAADKKIHVIEVNSGKEVAEINIGRPIGCSPELADSFMAVCEDGNGDNLLVINYLTGKLVWHTKTFGLCLPPLLYKNKIFWVDGQKSFNAANLGDGSKLWSVEIDKGFDAGPLIDNDNVIVVTEDSTLRCYDYQTGNPRWQRKLPGRANSSPACFDGQSYLCLGDGTVICCDMATGDMIWQYKDKPRLFFSPAIDSTGVYYGNGEGNFIKLDRNTGQKLWGFTTDAPIRGSALVTRKTVVFASLDHKVYLLNGENGQLLTSYATKSMIMAAPAILGDKLFIAAQDKYLYCFLLTGDM